MKRFIWVLVILSAAAVFSVRGLYADGGSGVVADKAIRDISEKQDRILQSLEEIKTELNIVKIRVSSR